MSPLPPPPERPDLERSVDSLRRRTRPVGEGLRPPVRKSAESTPSTLEEFQATLEDWERSLRARERAVLEREREISEASMLLAAKERQIGRLETKLARLAVQIDNNEGAKESELEQEIAERDEVIDMLESRLAAAESLALKLRHRIIILTADLEEATFEIEEALPPMPSPTLQSVVSDRASQQTANQDVQEDAADFDQEATAASEETVDSLDEWPSREQDALFEEGDPNSAGPGDPDEPPTEETRWESTAEADPEDEFSSREEHKDETKSREHF